jgi:hypothetical protein
LVDGGGHDNDNRMAVAAAVLAAILATVLLSLCVLQGGDVISY